MSVLTPSTGSTLRGQEGELVSVTITIEPRLLEQLLDALAHLDFPINPQLYHDAATISVCPNGTRRIQPAAVVDFPAWAGRLPAIRDALSRCGFDESCLCVKNMLEQLHANSDQQAAPPGAKYKAIVRHRHALRATA